MGAPTGASARLRVRRARTGFSGSSAGASTTSTASTATGSAAALRVRRARTGFSAGVSAATSAGASSAAAGAPAGASARLRARRARTGGSAGVSAATGSATGAAAATASAGITVSAVSAAAPCGAPAGRDTARRRRRGGVAVSPGSALFCCSLFSGMRVDLPSGPRAPHPGTARHRWPATDASASRPTLHGVAARTRGRTGARSLARLPARCGVSKVFWSDQSSQVFASCAAPQPRVAPWAGPAGPRGGGISWGPPAVGPVGHRRNGLCATTLAPLGSRGGLEALVAPAR